MTVSSEPLRLFQAVPDEAAWRELGDAWSVHLQGLWDHLSHSEAPWAWSEQTNVGLLANAMVAAGGFAMMELPIRDVEGGRRRGRFDLWLGKGEWSAHAEAKIQWAPGMTDLQVQKSQHALDRATRQTPRLHRKAWINRVASLVFVVPNVSARTPVQRLPDQMTRFAQQLANRAAAAPGSFLIEHRTPLAQLSHPLWSAQGRKRYYPGVILLGRVHKSE